VPPKEKVGTKPRLPLKRQRRYHSLSVTQGLRKKLPTDTQKALRNNPSIEEHLLPIAGGSMRYLKAGVGRPLILVHGLLGYSFSWRFTMPALAPHATVYAIDNLGAGLSPAPEGLDCTVRAAAERVLQFADSLGLAEFDLLGTSHGGAVAMTAAALCADAVQAKSVRNGLAAPATPGHRVSEAADPGPGESEWPDSKQRISKSVLPRVRRLILVAPVNPWSTRGRTLAPFLASPLGSLLFRHIVERWRGLDHLWLRRVFGDAAKIPPDSLAGYRVPILANHGFQYGAQIVKTWLADLADLESVLPKIRDCPTLLIWGTKDRAVDFASAEPLRQNFSNVRLVAFEGVGHLPYEECPKEFNQALIDFLEKSD
jgi:pimeloyl-ACP methyl ester carboxylesterase